MTTTTQQTQTIKPPLKLMSADFILTTVWPDPVWAIPKHLPVGLCLLAGKPKTGKSWLALQIAQAVASGGTVLGQQVQKGPVLYLALEDNGARLQRRMRAQSWPAGLDVEFMCLDEFAKQIGLLIPSGADATVGGDRLARQIELRQYRLVIIDTLSRSVSGDQSDMSAMTKALSPVQALALSKNCAVLMIDHHKKGYGVTPDAITDVLGSTAKGATADCVWGLYHERSKKSSSLHIVGRDVEEHELELTFDKKTGTWTNQGDAHAIRMTKNRQQVLDIVDKLGRATLKNVTDITGKDRGNMFRCLQSMVNAGILETKPDNGKLYYVRADPLASAMGGP
jgi:RecA-family ATPase